MKLIYIMRTIHDAVILVGYLLRCLYNIPLCAHHINLSMDGHWPAYGFVLLTCAVEKCLNLAVDLLSFSLEPGQPET